MNHEKNVLLFGVLVLLLVLIAPVSADILTANSVISQSATIGTAVTTPPSIRVINSSTGLPVSGVPVVFTVTNGGGTISAGGSSASAVTMTTGSDGIATLTSWILGATAGSNTLTVTNSSLTASPLTFSATGNAPASSANSITSISPTGGAQGSSNLALVITGTNFTTTRGSVRFERAGETDIVASITEWSTTQVKCTISKIPTGAETGKWDVIVVKGYDLSEIVKEDAFTITDPMTLTSITPTSGEAGDDDVDFTIAGKDLNDVDEVYLFNDDEDLTIEADDITIVSSTKITGSFDLEDAEEEIYDVCVKDDYGAIECDLEFEVTTNEVGEIQISSSPSGASIFVDDVAKGTTPQTVRDIVVGSHKVVLRKTGYAEWGRVVNVEADDTVEIDATLYVAGTATPSTTLWTPYSTTRPATAKTTIKKSTIKVPTTWADVPTTAPASPAEPASVIGALGIGLGLIALWRR